MEKEKEKEDWRQKRSEMKMKKNDTVCIHRIIKCINNSYVAKYEHFEFSLGKRNRGCRERGRG